MERQPHALHRQHVEESGLERRVANHVERQPHALHRHPVEGRPHAPHRQHVEERRFSAASAASIKWALAPVETQRLPNGAGRYILPRR